jgi:hypothetical protein
VINEFVLCRTRSAGIHCGVLAESAGTAILLTDARRIWRWRGANSIHELALHGADMQWTRISEPVPRILLTEAIEVIPCTAAARANLEQSRWGKE